jgi:hypothetical protein
MSNSPTARRITEAKPWGRRRVARMCLRWVDGVREDLHPVRISNWKDKTVMQKYPAESQHSRRVVAQLVMM